MRTLKLVAAVFLILSILSVTLPVGISRTAPTDVIQTVPPIVVSSPQAVSECTLLEAIPGSVVSGQSGFTMATCPNAGAAIRFRHTTSETPSFILSLGWSQIFLMQQGYPCSFNFTAGGLVGANMTSGGSIPFTETFGSTTALYAGAGMGYNYCLYYSNPPVGGVLSFTISWNP